MSLVNVVNMVSFANDNIFCSIEIDICLRFECRRKEREYNTTRAFCY